MPRIPTAQLEAIKRDVSCRAVLEAAGAVFQPHGSDVVCCCPFHDDRTPSLVVNERKNLWKCHGACGVGGDVIALTMKLRGVSFRHAAELLAEGLGGEAAASSFAAGGGGRPVGRSTARVLPCPLNAGADDAHLMHQVVDYYARRIDQEGNAGRAYLRQRGLDDCDLIRRFAIGFADRSLGLRLPNAQRVEGERLRSRLQALGLFRASGHEHFAGSVVVPIHGTDGTVVGMYGRKVTPNLRSGTPVHTYLAGKHRGVWNYGPDLVADGAVVVCEALLDAMSCWLVGIRHVTAAYGVNGWTADHDAALRTWQARDVFVAFDADAAGDAAASTRCDQLIAAGYTAYRVQFAPGLDANDTMRGADGDAALRAAIRNAAWVGGTPRVAVPALPAAAAVAVAAEAAAKAEAIAPAPVGVVAPGAPAAAASAFAAAGAGPVPGVVLTPGAGDEVAAVIGTRTYRVRGLARNRTPDVLKVNLRVAVATAADAAGERYHVDTLDLYQTRFRQAFIAAAAAETGLAGEVVKADLGRLLLALECHQAAMQRHTAAGAAGAAAPPPPADPVADLPPALREAALAFLRSPDLAERIVADLTACGLVGEDVNKLVAYLATSSRKLDSPLAVVVQSSSAAGKSTLMDRVLALMPPEDVRQYSAISGKSPFYLGTEGLKHRILAVAEEEGARRASYALKLLQSDGFLSMAATGKDPETGKLVTHDYRVEGPVMLMLTTTAIDVDPELLNRCLVLTVDESAAQTAAIQQAQRQARTLAGMAARRARDGIVALHRAAQRLLRPLTVVNPHAPALSFAAGQTRLRRDHAKYLALIDAVTLLHQHQRVIREHPLPDGTVLAYIEATAADIALADRLARVVLARSLDDLPPQTRRLWEGLSAFAAAEAARLGITVDRVRFTRRQVQAALGWSYQQARIHLDRLAEQEWIVAAGGGHGQVVQYRLVTDAPPTPTMGGLFGSEGVCSGIVGGGEQIGNDGKCRETAPESAGLFASCAHVTGGDQPPIVMSYPQAAAG